MAPSQLTSQQRVAKKLKDAKLLETKLQQQWICAMMKKHSEITQTLLSSVESNTGEKFIDYHSGPSLCGSLALTNGDVEDVDPQLLMTAKWADAQESDISPDKRLPAGITRFGALAPGFLKPLLRTVQPVVFSRFSLRGLAAKGKREATREDLMRLLTLVSGIDDMSYLTPELRSWGPLVAFIAEAVRATNFDFNTLSMPPNYPTCGHYSVSSTPEGVCLSETSGHQFRAIRIPKSLIPGKVASSGSDLFVEMNWSKTQAALSDGRDVCCMTVAAQLDRFHSTHAVKNARAGPPQAAEPLLAPKTPKRRRIALEELLT